MICIFINATTGSNIAMMAEDMSMFGDITAQEYVESLSEQLSSYADQGITYAMNAIGTKTIGNTEFVSLDGIAEYQSNNIYQCYAVTEMGRKCHYDHYPGPADQGQTECEAVLASTNRRNKIGARMNYSTDVRMMIYY